MSTPVICRQHQWQQTKTPGVLICVKCQATGKARSPYPRREQRALQPPASPHYAGHYAGLHPEDQPQMSEQLTRRDVTTYQEEVDDVPTSYYEPPRMPNSTRRYAQPLQQQVEYDFQEEIVHTKIPSRAAQTQPEEPQRRGRKPKPNLNHAQPPEVVHLGSAPKRRVSGWFLLGCGMLVMLGLWVGISWLAHWATNTHNDMTYTSHFRTFSIDAVVDHNGDSKKHPSHFIVQNDKQQIIIVELPADDTSKAIIYLGPQLIGEGQEKTPVTVSFQFNASTGKVDMVLHIQDQQYIYTNTGKKFVPQDHQ